MSKTTRILICDDDPIVHQSLSLYLDHEDFLHDSAYDGKQALEMIKTGEIRDGKTVLLLNYLQSSHLMD